MSQENSNKGLKIGLGILILLLIGASSMFFLKNNELNETKKGLTSEISALETDLITEKNNLTKKISENEVLNEDLVAKRDSLSLTIEALKSSKADVKTLMKYKYSFFKLKKDIKKLLADNESLQLMNTQLTKVNDSISTDLVEQRKLSDSLNTQVVERNTIIQSASEITVAGLKGMAIIEKSSGRQVVTSKARRADKVKICFAVAENTIAEKGDKELYVQVLDANNNVLGENAAIMFDEKTLNYSFKTEFNYANKALDICEYLLAPKKGFDKGNYFVNIFRGDKMIANQSFVLK